MRSLCSFDRCLAFAARQVRVSGDPHYILRTGQPERPFIVLDNTCRRDYPWLEVEMTILPIVNTDGNDPDTPRAA